MSAPNEDAWDFSSQPEVYDFCAPPAEVYDFSSPPEVYDFEDR
jgi:hypothetical protein